MSTPSPVTDIPHASAAVDLQEVTEYLPPDSEAGLQLVTETVTAEEPGFSFDSLPPFPHLLRHPLRATAWIVSLLFGVASLVLLLAVIAAIPLVNFLALGYLLEAEGRVARTGKLRYALPLLPLAPRLGSIFFGIWFWLLLVRAIADAASDAAVIAPDSAVATGWRVASMVVSVGVTIHLLLALARGGGFWCFFRPIKNLRWLLGEWRAGQYAAHAEAAVSDFFAALRIPYHFWLGIRGFVGTFLWLFIPTALFSVLQDTTKGGQVLITLIGAVLLLPILSWTPFLQAHFAAENRFGAFRDLTKIRQLYGQTPIVWFLAVVVLYALALPLYLFKIAAPPQDALWFVTLIFISTIYPARIFVGWAYAYANHRTQPQWFFIRWPLWLVLMPLLAFYLFLLFFTPAIGAEGRRVLFEHHALLLPTPF